MRTYSHWSSDNTGNHPLPTQVCMVVATLSFLFAALLDAGTIDGTADTREVCARVSRVWWQGLSVLCTTLAQNPFVVAGEIDARVPRCNVRQSQPHRHNCYRHLPPPFKHTHRVSVTRARTPTPPVPKMIRCLRILSSPTAAHVGTRSMYCVRGACDPALSAEPGTHWVSDVANRRPGHVPADTRAPTHLHHRPHPYSHRTRYPHALAWVVGLPHTHMHYPSHRRVN